MQGQESCRPVSWETVRNPVDRTAETLSRRGHLSPSRHLQTAQASDLVDWASEVSQRGTGRPACSNAYLHSMLSPWAQYLTVVHTTAKIRTSCRGKGFQRKGIAATRSADRFRGSAGSSTQKWQYRHIFKTSASNLLKGAPAFYFISSATRHHHRQFLVYRRQEGALADGQTLISSACGGFGRGGEARSSFWNTASLPLAGR